MPSSSAVVYHNLPKGWAFNGVWRQGTCVRLQILQWRLPASRGIVQNKKVGAELSLSSRRQAETSVRSREINTNTYNKKINNNKKEKKSREEVILSPHCRPLI